MSAGHSAPTQVRRKAPAAPARHDSGSRAARSTRAFAFTAPRGEEEIRLNLSDIPSRHDNEMHVEGFKPSLLSRLLDLVMPLR